MVYITHLYSFMVELEWLTVATTMSHRQMSSVPSAVSAAMSPKGSWQPVGACRPSRCETQPWPPMQAEDPSGMRTSHDVAVVSPVWKKPGLRDLRASAKHHNGRQTIAAQSPIPLSFNGELGRHCSHWDVKRINRGNALAYLPLLYKHVTKMCCVHLAIVIHLRCFLRWLLV